MNTETFLRQQLAQLHQRPIVIATHRRSGTHLTIDTLRKQFPDMRSWKWPLERLDRLYLSYEALLSTDSQILLDSNRALSIAKRCARPIVKTHLIPETPESLQEPWMDWFLSRGKVIYVMRDVRDVMCSWHLMQTAVKLRTNESPLPISEFLRQSPTGRNRVGQWVHHIRTWLAIPDVLLVRYEDILKNTRSVLTKIGEHVGSQPEFCEPLLPKKPSSRWELRWQRIIGIRPECTVVLARPKGMSRTHWSECFSSDDLRFIYEHAGELGAEMGYDFSPASASLTI